MKKYLALFKQTFSEFSGDKVPRLGAALAYYTVFSIAPLLLIAIAIAGFAFGKEAASGAVYAQLRGVLGPSSASMIEQMVKSAAKPKSGIISTVIGIVTLLLGASGVIGQLKDALNTIWDVKPNPNAGFMGTIKTYVLNGAVVIGAGFLLLVSLVIDTAVAAMGKFAEAHLPGGEVLWQVVQLAFSFVVITVVFALVFRVLPDLKIEWRDVWFGAAFTSFLFVVGKFVLSLWIAKAAAGSTYGAAGSLVAVLLWVYYAAQIVLFGAEFTQVYARTHGSRAAETKANEAAAAKEREEAAKPPVAYPPLQPAAAKTSSGGGAGKVAAGGVAGLLLGALAGGIGATVVVVKSVKKLITFR